MATGALDANGVWLYGEDDSEPTFSGLLNKLGSSVGTTLKGRIAQIATATNATVLVSSTTTPVSVVSVSFTPKFATSRIILLGNVASPYKNSAASLSSTNFDFRKNGTSVQRINYGLGYMGGFSGDAFFPPVHSIFQETAGSTTARTYALTFNVAAAGTPFTVNWDSQSTSSLTVIEVTQ